MKEFHVDVSNESTSTFVELQIVIYMVEELQKSTTIASHSSLKARHKGNGKFLIRMADTPMVSLSIQKRVPHGVFTTLMMAFFHLISDMLFMRVMDRECWKFILLYWRHAKHTKYSLQALHLLAEINATATARIAHELIWCRFINTRGVPRGKIPVDQYLNHTLKDYPQLMCRRQLSFKQAHIFKDDVTF